MNPPQNQQYETLYGVHLLDDLHNYFPALLYDSSEFQSVQSVLRYIQQQTRARFDLFSYGLREYLNTHPQPSGLSVGQRVVRTSPGGTFPPSTVLPSTFPAPPPMHPASRSPVTVEVNLTNLLSQEEAEEEEEEQSPPLETALSQALLNLLHLPAGTLTRDYRLGGIFTGIGRRGMDQFLQPVVIRPSAEQIAANTTVGNLVSDTEQACAICQDALTSDQEGRKLNACGHWFHKNCIDTWLNGNVHCPVCRHDIREPARQTSSENSYAEAVD